MLEREWRDVRVLVPVSGGKDSQACLKLALANYRRTEILPLFCDTGFEHPLTYKHVSDMADYYGVQIAKVTAGTVIDQSIQHRRFPGGGARHCTDNLKIQPTKKFLKLLAECQGSGFEVWYGMRADESPERAKRYMGKVCDELYAPHEVIPSKYPKYLSKMGVKFRLAILDWSAGDVFQYLDGECNPLYESGFDRVGCFPCLAAGDAYKEKAFGHDDFGKSQLVKVQLVERVIGKSIWTSKGGIARNGGAGCAICSM
jgi:3'-phosphoadenosine 5'-phosphosulfate sulfotransferase (PAPS reductase)/FAD synthetase